VKTFDGGIDLRNVVVAPQPRAAEVGIRMFQRGGNAVDAAVATAFAQGVMDPLWTSLGGFGMMLIHMADATEPIALSFHGTVPGKATPDMFTPIGEEGSTPMATGTWRVKDDANQLGYLAPTVPGLVRGLTDAHRRFGRLKLEEVVEPAAQIAEEGGWRVTPRQISEWTREPPEGRRPDIDRFCATPAARAIYTNNGQLWSVGSSVKNPDLARTLRAIGREGPDVFYKGYIARQIAEDFGKNGGLISYNDLCQYKTDNSPPLRIRYKEYEVFTTPPPSGGLTVLEILNLLSGFDLGKYRHNSVEYLHLLAEAFRWSFRDFSQYLADPAFVDVPVERLLSKDHAEEMRCWFNPERRSCLAADDGMAEPKDTTHVSVVDAEGNAVSLTHSLGAASGVVTPGLGFIFNGQMHRFNPYPGHINSIAPGKRRPTGMSPTIVTKNGRPVLVLGAPGGHGIIHGVVQTILNILEYGMPATEAVSVPRLHCENHGITLESRFSTDVVKELTKMGHQVFHSLYPYDRATGHVQVIKIDWPLDSTDGGSDPRTEGVAMYY